MRASAAASAVAERAARELVVKDAKVELEELVVEVEAGVREEEEISSEGEGGEGALRFVPRAGRSHN